MPCKPLHAWVLGLLVLAVPASAPAQEDTAKAEAAGLVELATPQIQRGAWYEAISNLKKALAVEPANEPAALLLSVAYEQSGELDKAEEATASLAATASALTRQAELRHVRGDAKEAEARARAAVAADENHLPAWRLVGLVLEETGRRDEAVKAYLEVNTRWAKNEGDDTDDDLLAEARARLGIYRLSEEHKARLNSVIDRLEPVIRRSPHRVDALVELGDLYLGMHQDIDARRWYEKAFEQNPHYAPALYGKARQLAFRYEEVEAAAECERALRENPAHVPSLLFLAEMALGDGAYDKADGLIGKALAVNAQHAPARAARAALLYLRGDETGFDAEVKAILDRNRFASVAYALAGRVLEEQRRFAEAFALAKKAVATDPRDWESYFLAGRNALNVGDDAAGEKYLADAAKGDPFDNRYRANFLNLFRRIANFPVRRDETFVIRMPPEEEEPYYPLLRAAAGRSLDDLQAKWKTKSELPLYAAVFDQQDDFATRTIGLPGFPALGACFGRVLTLDSPRALPPGAFGWRGTLHHELAHVITLQLSKGRVPRWLTEGVSVYEERKVSPTWNREMERDLVNAIASDEVLTLDAIDAAFRGPRVLYAYYQGGLMCELIERDFGFDALREMVRLYGDELSTRDVVKRALGIDAAEFDRRFLAYAKDYVKDLRVLPRPSDEKMAKLRRETRQQAKSNPDAWLLLALGHVARKDSPSALSALTNVVKLRPDEPGAAVVRALVAWRENRPEQAVKHAEEAIAKGADFYDLRMALGTFYAAKERDVEKAKAHYRRAIELFPFQKGDGDPRLALSKLLMSEGETTLPEAMALLRAHADVDEDDFQTRLQLANWYSDQGRADDELLLREQIRDVVPLPHGPWRRDAATDLHERLGEMYLDRKRYADAELAFGTAVAVARMDLGRDADPPLDPQTLADLLARHAETLHLLGRTDDARRRLDEALRADPENARAQDLRRTLP